MRSPAVVPALAFVAGVGIGVAGPVPVFPVAPLTLGVVAVVVMLLARSLARACRQPVVGLALGVIGALHGAQAREAALHPTLRTVLDQAVGGFSIDRVGVGERHEPIRLRAELTEDAAEGDGFVSLRVRSRALLLNGSWQSVAGSLVLTVNGAAAPARDAAWRAGRTIEAPVTFRRPARYLDAGVADFERDAALSGIALLGTVKSGLLVEVVSTGTRLDEAAATVRAFVRASVARWVTPHGAVPGAIVTAVLIGDRTGLPDDIRARLQSAGTYHVIAISGGNIAIFATLIVITLSAFGVHGRYIAVVTIATLLGYAQVATTGPSVWRATVMAVLYFGARILDHRTTPVHALAMAAAVLAATQPLDVRDAGFLLTFGATAGLLGVAPLVEHSTFRRRVVAWLVMSVAGSLAVELVLLPVSAHAFSRITAAGLVLNLIAIPAMTIVQVAGMLIVALSRIDVAAAIAGWVAAIAAAVLVDSARLVEWWPWLAQRVPAPGPGLVVVYYGGLALVWWMSRLPLRLAGGLALLASLVVIVSGAGDGQRSASSRLQLTVFDVGQGDSLLLEVPGGEALLIDTGGSPVGSSLDVGARVLAPALWARGVRRLDDLLVTHGDPDHIGGAVSVLTDFHPREVWWGIPVPPHLPSRSFLQRAGEQGSPVAHRRLGDELWFGSARVRVLNPPEAEWERQRVRNDDSVVLEVVYGEVAFLLTGDITAAVERALVPQLTAARVRVLKVAHHGSRTSSSQELLNAWRPQIALISCGRGNTFGHPAPEVLDRLESIGARVYRTDRDGEITVTSDGRDVSVGTFIGGQ